MPEREAKNLRQPEARPRRSWFTALWPFRKEPIITDPSLPPVVLIHGLGVPHHFLSLLDWRLRRLYGRRTINVVFGTWRNDLPACAEIVSRTLREKNVRQIDVVTHSTGGIIFRWAMNHRPMPRVRRAVLIAPPNSGAWLADFLSRILGPVYPLIFGQIGLQLRRGNKGILPLAGLLDGIEFGIIAGGSGTPRGKRNIFRIPGDCDGVVAVEETILPGMRDFILLNLDHTRLQFSRQTAHMVNLFLEHGIFRPPLPGETEDEEH